MPSPDLTPAEIDMLRCVPETFRASDMTGWTPRQQRDAKVRRRLQAAGLITVREQHDGVFLVMITDAGVAALAQAGAR
jgi:DNA-binding PadR family transcriptional regulator